MIPLRGTIQKYRLATAWARAKAEARVTDLSPILPPLDTASLYVRENPDLMEEWVARGERVASGEVPLLSAGNACRPPFENWRKHQLSGASIPRFSALNHETFGPGDLWLACWLNTLPYAPLLAHSSVLNGATTRDYLVQMIDSWVQDQWPVPSPYWSSGLEVALRAIGLLYTASMAPDLPAPTRQQITQIAILSGEVLERACERQSYNHLLVEAYGLFCIGRALHHAEWMKRGATILEAELDRQFFPDGMHAERCIGYMCLIGEIYLQFRILGAQDGLQFSPDFDTRVLRMCDAAAELCNDDGTLSNFADNSELALFSGGKDLRTMFALAAVVFSSPSFKTRAGRFPVPAFWIAGDQGYRAFRDLAAPEPVESRSSALVDSGFYTMRDADRVLRITCGRELSPKNGHSHADLLSFELQVGGDTVLRDAGTGSYYPLTDWRHYFRSTAAHNTVTVDGQDQALPIPGDSFGWTEYPRFKVHEWTVGPGMDVFDAEHHGYARLKQPVIHRRKIVFRKPGCWIIFDDIDGTSEHDCDLHFQFSPGDVALDGSRAIATRSWGRLEVWQMTENCEVSLESGALNPIRGWVSSGYGHQTPAPSLRFRKSGKVPVRFCTVILAATQGQQTQVVSNQDGLEIRLGDSLEMFSEEALTAGGGIHV